MKPLERSARIGGRLLGFAGLATVYLSLFISLLQVHAPRESVLKAGFIAAAAGCLSSLRALLWPRGDKGRVAWEVALGILCLPLGSVSGVLADGDELGLQPGWIAITIVFLGLAVALVVQAARVKRAAERRRNAGNGD